MKKTKVHNNVIKFELKFLLLVFLADLSAVIMSYYIMPLVQNFPPYTENFAFQDAVQVLTHVQQYSIALAIAFIIHSLSFRILMKRIYKYLNKYYNHEDISYEEILQVRKDCINIPYKFFVYQIALFLSIGLLFNFIMLVSVLSIVRFTLMMISIASILSVLLLVVSKMLLHKVILTTYEICPKYEKNIGWRVKNSRNIIIQMTPIFLVILIIISLIGYSKAVTQEGFASANYYKAYIQSKEISKYDVSMENLKNILNTIPLNNEKDYYFIITPNDKEIYTSNPDGKVSSFALTYRDFFGEKTNGIWYEEFGVDEQLYSYKLSDTEGNTWYIGYKYETIDASLLGYYSAIIVVITLLFSYIVYLLTKNLTRDSIAISTNLKEILKDGSGKKLPITSNDEFGDLSYYYNKIQELNASNIEELKNNQEKLMEKERLATLGQMVGGIAHNLKTPIMSIAGACEGLDDLISEYYNSVGDPEVTIEDHHEIAKDMKKWIDKIETHSEYMSDVITAVKGQVVTLSNQEVISFTIDELIKRVNILMRHELKNSLINLNIDMNNVDKDLALNGDINSLVQVLNNLISNAIQSYDGQTNKEIDLDFEIKDNKLIISVRDYGKGIPQETQAKLFKEMVTTKGKNGTGLGLFMSYSNIKAHFNGNITFESELGKGSIFNIIIPIK